MDREGSWCRESCGGNCTPGETRDKEKALSVLAVVISVVDSMNACFCSDYADLFIALSSSLLFSFFPEIMSTSATALPLLPVPTH